MIAATDAETKIVSKTKGVITPKVNRIASNALFIE